MEPDEKRVRHVHTLQDAEDKAPINGVKSFGNINLDRDSARASVPMIAVYYFRSKDIVFHKKTTLDKGSLVWEYKRWEKGLILFTSSLEISL